MAQNKFKQYGVIKNDLSTLKIRMDEMSVSLIIAQAAKETGWDLKICQREMHYLDTDLL